MIIHASIIPREIVELVRVSSDIVEVVGEHVQLRRSGANFFGRCPFHSDKTPSLSISPAKQLFYCHGCGVGGDVLEFVQRLNECSFPQSVKFLAAYAGICIDGFKPSPALIAKVAALRAQREAESAFTQFYNSRVDEVYRVNRALACAATNAEKALQAGGLDPAIENLHWDALKWYRQYEARIERDGIADRDVLQVEWERHAVAA